eukprot:3627236-Rhodomonas_salina.1
MHEITARQADGERVTARQIINKTMEMCFSDLYHFLLMFITFLFGFAVMSHVLFGPQLPQFQTLLEALMTGWMMMNGAGLSYMQLAYVNGQMAAVFFLVRSRR